MQSTDVLERKRKELEQEIADFRSRKEDEYRAFERHYFHGSSDSITSLDSGDGTRLEKSRSLTRQKESGQQSSFGLDSTGRCSCEDSQRPQEEGYLERQASEADPESTGSLSLRATQDSQPGSLNMAQLHERELEFQGLFTPSFLPLLDGNGRDHFVETQKQIHTETGSALASLSNRKDIDGSSARSKSNLSSSASFPIARHSSSLSPPPVRPLPASVPRQPPHQRRSSSRSDTSIACLRSSLRDPKQPRSPKRVLFSIGDKVVSPSTSPLMQRAKAESSTIESAPPTRHDESGAIKTQGAKWDMFPWSKERSNVVPTGTAYVGFGDTMSKPLSNGLSTKSPFLGGEEFECIEDDDDVFAFDEDVNTERLKGEKEDVAEATLGSDEDEDGNESLPAGSPHAGSLPIEIKWPSRFVSDG